MRRPEPRRRVLVVSHTHPRLTQGGGEIAAFETFRRLSESPAFETWLLSHDAGLLPARAGAPIVQPFGPREYLYVGRSYDPMLFANTDPNFPAALVDLLLFLKPDVVHFHHFVGIGVEAIAIVRKTLPNAQIILTLHEYYLICNHFGQMVTRPNLELCYASSPLACHSCFPEHSPQTFFLRNLWLKRYLSAVDLFIAPSRFLRDRFVAWGLSSELMRIMENPLPPAPTRQVELSGKERAWSRIGYFGQISELKGLNILFAAARLLLQREWKGIIEVHGKVQPLPDNLQRRLDSLLADVPSNVVMCGYYANEAVSELMARCDAVVVPSIWWENSPLVVQEAATVGVTVIGADIGGLGEKLREIPGSILVRARDPMALAEAIAALPLRSGSVPIGGRRAKPPRGAVRNPSVKPCDHLSLYRRAGG